MIATSADPQVARLGIGSAAVVDVGVSIDPATPLGVAFDIGTPLAHTFDFAPADVNTGTDVITHAAHGLTRDQPIKFSTTGTLPAGLTAGVIYHATDCNVTPNTFTVSTMPTSQPTGFGAVHPINLTSQGTGTHTVTWAEPLTVREADGQLQSYVEQDRDYPLRYDIRHGSLANPVTTQGPTFKVSRTQEFTTGNEGNPAHAPSFSAIEGICVGKDNDVAQAVGGMFTGRTTGQMDVGGIFGIARAYGATYHGAGGGYFEGAVDHPAGNPIGVELRAIGNHATDGVWNGPTGQPAQGMGSWATYSAGAYSSYGGCAYAVGNINKWVIGFGAVSGSVYDTVLRDDNSCLRGIHLAGTYSTAAIDLPSTAGNRETGIKFGASTYLHYAATTQLMMSATASATTAAFHVNAAASQKALVIFDAVSVDKWELGKAADDSFFLWDNAGSQTSFQVVTGDGLKLGGTYSVAALQLPSTSGSTTSGIKYGTDTFLHRSATTQLMLNGTSSAGTNTQFHINAAASRQATVSFTSANTEKWKIGKETDDTFLLRDGAATQNVFTITTGEGLKLGGTYSTAAIQITATAGTEVTGLLFGGDVNLYRSAADILKVKDSVDINTVAGAASSNYDGSSLAQSTGVYLAKGGEVVINRSSLTGGAFRIFGATGELSRLTILGSNEMRFNKSDATRLLTIKPDSTTAASATGMIIGGSTTEAFAFHNGTPRAQAAAMTARNATAPGVVYTAAEQGIIANLQTRVNELADALNASATGKSLIAGTA